MDKYPKYLKGSKEHKEFKAKEQEANVNNRPTYNANGLEYKNTTYRQPSENVNMLQTKSLTDKPNLEDRKVDEKVKIRLKQASRPTIYKNVEVKGKKGVLSNVSNLFKYGTPKYKTPDGNNVYLKRKPIKVS